MPRARVFLGLAAVAFVVMLLAGRQRPPDTQALLEAGHTPTEPPGGPSGTATPPESLYGPAVQP